jgi:hypothetical protein
MACWQRSWQLTHPPAAARLRRTDRNTTKASVAATAALPAAAVMVMINAAVAKKCPADRPNTTITTRTANASPPAGRA